MPSPVLFLDFDGVLNNDSFLRYQKNHVARSEHRLFDPENVRALERLIATLEIETVVVTSTWRKDRTLTELRTILSKEGFRLSERIQSVTAVLGRSYEARAAEIVDWVAKHSPTSYVVLDDFDLSETCGKSFYKVDPALGLTEAAVDSIASAFRDQGR
jgi:hypothetical protein